MKHIRLTLTILALLAFSAISAFAAKYNFLIATDAPAGSSWVKAMEEISLKMQKNSAKTQLRLKSSPAAQCETTVPLSKKSK